MINTHNLQTPKLDTGTAEIGMAPLVDVVFLLLIFFMVTTVFPENQGLEIDKPAAENTTRVSNENIVLKIDHNNALYFHNQQLVIADIKRLLHDEMQLHPEAAVIIHADKKSPTDTLITVIDTAKSVGVTKLGVATDDSHPH